MENGKIYGKGGVFSSNLVGYIENGKVYSLLTAFPGNPNIPPASEWNGEYAVIVPTKEKKDNSDL